MNQPDNQIMPKIWRQIPLSVWMLGLVSLFMDISSEMIHSLLPTFIVTTLGASVLMVGIIEGVSESLALITKVFSGILSDYLGTRKKLALFGYALAAFTKPLFALAGSSHLVFTARLLDRLGKGIRGAPRDALIADITPPNLRGAAFGLRQSLDTIGAFLGPLCATGFMFLLANNFRAIFWIATVPAFIAVALLFFAVQEPTSPPTLQNRKPIQIANLRHLGHDYWWIVGIGTLFTLSRFSEAFLILRALHAGIPLTLTPLIMVTMNLVYAATAYPFGKLSDRTDPRKLLKIGIIILIIADLILAIDQHWSLVLLGIIFWGIHMGMTQGLFTKLVADTAPAQLRGTAYGFFNLASGTALLIASILAGSLWDRYGFSMTFYTGAFFCILVLLGLVYKSHKS